VFVRGAAEAGPAEITRRIAELPIGSIGAPSGIRATARVPRGEIHFQPRFIGELKELLAMGSVTVGEAVAALGGAGRDPVEITRNLLYLVASGSLTPFARAYRVIATSTPPGFASATIERVLAHIVATGATRAVPSEVLGNGISMTPHDAAAIIELAAGRAKLDTVRELASTLWRLAILV
jgi:hypothetical protein